MWPQALSSPGEVQSSSSSGTPGFAPFSSKSYKQGGLLGEFSRNFTLKTHKQILKPPKKPQNQTNPEQASPPQETNERQEETKPEVWGRRCWVLSPWNMEYPSLQDRAIPGGQSHPCRMSHPSPPAFPCRGSHTQEYPNK